MKTFIVLCLAAATAAMPYGPVVESAWGAPAIAHAPIAYAQPVVKQFVQPHYVHAAPVVKAIAPAASSYSSFSQVHHPQQVVKHVVAQPVYQPSYVKQVVAQPVYQPSYVKSVVAQPVIAHNPW